IKEFKEKDKDRYEKALEKRFDKQLEKRAEKQVEKQIEKQAEKQREGGLTPTGGDIEGRLASLEAMVGDLTHFITSELRPDLAQGAQGYAGEYDDPEVAAQMAKDEKDGKDTENL
ncbi:MAG: hypothetical protein PF480_04300, partial [Roseovarius sp.]|nr:hypothetical protein [Roseovarius sp.]